MFPKKIWTSKYKYPHINLRKETNASNWRDVGNPVCQENEQDFLLGLFLHKGVGILAAVLGPRPAPSRRQCLLPTTSLIWPRASLSGGGISQTSTLPLTASNKLSLPGKRLFLCPSSHGHIASPCWGQQLYWCYWCFRGRGRQGTDVVLSDTCAR